MSISKVYVLSKTTTCYLASSFITHYTDLYGYFDDKTLALKSLQLHTNNEFVSRINWSSRVDPPFDDTVECYKITAKQYDRSDQIELRITEIPKL